MGTIGASLGSAYSFLMRIELGIPGYVLLIAFYGIIIAISQNQADNGNSYWCSILVWLPAGKSRTDVLSGIVINEDLWIIPGKLNKTTLDRILRYHWGVGKFNLYLVSFKAIIFTIPGHLNFIYQVSSENSSITATRCNQPSYWWYIY